MKETPCNIAIENPDGSISAIYCDTGGGLHEAGKLLGHVYSAPDIRHLIALGNIQRVHINVMDSPLIGSLSRKFCDRHEWRDHLVKSSKRYRFAYLLTLDNQLLHTSVWPPEKPMSGFSPSLDLLPYNLV